MGCNIPRLPFILLSWLLLAAATALALERSDAFRPEGAGPRCSDQINILLQTRLDRLNQRWQESNPKATAMELEAQKVNQVVQAEAIKTHALKRYKCDLELTL
jgi:hypothetical protein